MTSQRLRCLAGLALGTLLLAACSNGTHLAESQFTTKTPEVTPTSTPIETTTTTQSPVPPPGTHTPPVTPKPPRTPPTKSPPVGTGNAASPLSLGTFHQVGSDFRVSITGVNLDADQAIKAANQFNKPPHGRYVLAEISVAYLGNNEGSPWIDLRIKFDGSDARQYDSSQCGAVVARPGIFLPTLEHGGREHYQVCFDVPPAAIAAGKIFVEQTFLFDSPRLYWKIR